MVFLRVLEIAGRNPFTGSTDDFYHIEGYIEREEYDMLSLPFKFVLGERVKEAQTRVVEAVSKTLNHAEVWSEVQIYHDSTLGLAHRTFDEGFVNLVYDQWLQRKLQKYRLHELEEMLRVLNEN